MGVWWTAGTRGYICGVRKIVRTDKIHGIYLEKKSASLAFPGVQYLSGILCFSRKMVFKAARALLVRFSSCRSSWKIDTEGERTTAQEKVGSLYL